MANTYKVIDEITWQNFSFTLAFVYAVCKCANEIEAFRYRFLDGSIVLFDKIDTYAILDDIVYKYPAGDNYFAYISRGCTNKCSFCAVPILESIEK